MGFTRASLTALVAALVLPWCSGSVTGPEPAEPLPGAVAWSRHRVDGEALPDAEQAEPQTVADFLTDAGRQNTDELVERFPFVMGNLDGAPLRTRFAANRRAIALERARLAAVAADQSLSEPARSSARRTEAMYRRLAENRRPVLLFDPRGRGRYAEVHGDLANATHVAVVVPGTGISTRSFDPRSGHVGTPGAMAAELYRTQRALSPAASTAVVAWAGYATPQALGVGAATARYAEAGAEELRDLIDGLIAARSSPDAGHPTRSTTRVTLLCHSYGSVVCGRAAEKLPEAVHDIVVFGSPGMGVDTVTELHTDARLWAALGPSDWIRHVPNVRFLGFGHGRAPTSAAFGARRIPATDVRGHDGYLHRDTDTARRFAQISLDLVSEPHHTGADTHR
ncbi:alpha/beta hydrolase [Actinoalloteichus hymeniacidonis]|uniref:Alpha/beta hydrolase n=1 Tax=Actinoalloteichus hymeniacidonis TaxID=340345 RepID=A0AAC9HP06_9PSEU|nr:alpha/beta hydrolase [Actinoalloteichus hymeniacidonis]AOS62793.1 Alpha/beta hydrolase [Actinoalloteichus hymeniacidonis]MBB5909176.1 pimeloyl-ACP methyl ester carboxylesterase [Actinoalloteichus hymeniacidonis]